MKTGTSAEQDGLPLPTGYEALRDTLVAAARLRCTELALAEDPPLMFTDCLSAPVSTPYPLSETETCTVCVETSVWSDAKHEVECPPGLDGTDEGDGTTTEPPGTSGGSADDTGEGGGAVFDCAAWAPEASITSAYYASGRPEGWYHVMHAGLLEGLVESGFAPAIACDQGRYVPRDDGTWAFAHVTAGDLLWILGVRSGYQSARLRAYDPVTHAGTTAWIPIETIDGALAAYEVLLAHDHLELAMLDPTGPDRVERHVFIALADCTTPSGVQCPPP